MFKMICLLWTASIGNNGVSPIISNVLIEERKVETNYRSESENEIFIDVTSESENFVYEVDPISNEESLTWQWALYDYHIGGYASSIGGPVVEQYLVITWGFGNEPRYKEFTKQRWNRTSTEPTLKFGSSFGTDNSNEQAPVYTYYDEVKEDVNNIESARKYSNDLWAFRVGLAGYIVKAGTVWSYNDTEKVFRLHFIFYTRVWINGGSPIIPYFSNLDWNLGNSLTIIRE